MNLDRLQEFVVIAERGSLSAAADVLKIAPSTLGARLRASPWRRPRCPSTWGRFWIASTGRGRKCASIW